MTTYAILYNPGHNRVYFDTSLKLAAAELGIAAGLSSTEYTNIRNENIFGTNYLIFETCDKLSEKDIKIISNLSFIYALFEAATIEGELYLKPILRLSASYVDESIGSILKYTGKTNEIFTRMMLNIAYCSQPCRGNIKLLDPVAGKGTTLYEGLIKGYNVYGIEIGEKVTAEACTFMKKFLETSRYKFTFNTMKVSGEKKSFSAVRHTFEIAKTKYDFKSKNTKIAEFISGNSLYADKLFKRDYFDMIVGDLPYGIQHGNVTNEKQSSMTRNPAELLNLCVPSWYKVLRRQGVIVLSWNLNVLSRVKAIQILEEKGLVVENEGFYTQFEHRVDQAIKRDIIVARKP